MFASAMGHSGAAAVLLELVSSTHRQRLLTEKDVRGRTALRLAQSGDCKELIDLLREASKQQAIEVAQLGYGPSDADDAGTPAAAAIGSSERREDTRGRSGRVRRTVMLTEDPLPEV